MFDEVTASHAVSRADWDKPVRDDSNLCKERCITREKCARTCSLWPGNVVDSHGLLDEPAGENCRKSNCADSVLTDLIEEPVHPSHVPHTVDESRITREKCARTRSAWPGNVVDSHGLLDEPAVLP